MDTNDDGAYLTDISQVKSQRKSLSDSKKIFVDKDFPTELVFESLKNRPIQWKRLAELEKQAGLCLDGDPLKGMSCEGLLGNDSVAAAITAISHNLRLLNYIFPPRQNYENPGFTGLFYMRFWKMGKWVYVVIDDRLPVVGPERTPDTKKKSGVKAEKSSTSSGKLSKSSSASKSKSGGDVATGKDEPAEPKTNSDVHKALIITESEESRRTLKSKKSKSSLKSQSSRLKSKSETKSKEAMSKTSFKGVAFAPNEGIHEDVPMRNREIFLQIFGPDGSRYFWLAVLEKAYAKFCGGYAKSASKSVQDVLLDMTGGVTEVFRTSLLPPHFFLSLKQYCDTNCAIVATTCPRVSKKSADPDLPSVSSLAVTNATLADFRKLFGINKMVSFVRIKNPYETLMWHDNWTEAANDWQILPELVKEKLSMAVREDGEFYLTYENFLRAFESIVVSIVPDGNRFNCDGYFGNWTQPRGRYDMNNLEELRFPDFPQYKIWVRDPNSEGCAVDFVISLIQNGKVTDPDIPPFRTIRICIFALDENRTYAFPLGFEFFRYNSPIAYSTMSCHHEASTRLQLVPGEYLAVLVTKYTVDKPFPNDDFLLRVVTAAEFHKGQSPTVVRSICYCEDLNVNIDGAVTLEEPVPPEKRVTSKTDMDARKDRNRGRRRKIKTAHGTEKT